MSTTTVFVVQDDFAGCATQKTETEWPREAQGEKHGGGGHDIGGERTRTHSTRRGGLRTLGAKYDSTRRRVLQATRHQARKRSRDAEARRLVEQRRGMEGNDTQRIEKKGRRKEGKETQRPQRTQ